MREVEVTCFPPLIRKQVQFLMKKQQIGLGRDRVKVLNPSSSLPSFQTDGNCDRFKVVIPYAGIKFEVFIIMQATDPATPPDFLFANTRFSVVYEEMMSLLYWDINECDSLWKVVKELYNLYRKKNIEDLEIYCDLYQEYAQLLQLNNFSEEDIEIHVPFRSRGPITMLVRLNSEFCDILPDVNHKEGVSTALLFINFPNRDIVKYHPRLYLSDDLSAALHFDKKFNIKNLMRKFHLGRYVIAVDDKLRCQNDLVAGGYESRKAYFATFLSHFQGAVLEYDITYFFTLNLLVQEEDFHVFVEINLPANYPNGIPYVTFRSVYHMENGKPKTAVVESYNYSPDWPLDKVLNETACFISNYVLMMKEDIEQNI